jgi:hypothetical protein
MFLLRNQERYSFEPLGDNKNLIAINIFGFVLKIIQIRTKGYKIIG